MHVALIIDVEIRGQHRLKDLLAPKVISLQERWGEKPICRSGISSIKVLSDNGFPKEMAEDEIVWLGAKKKNGGRSITEGRNNEHL